MLDQRLISALKTTQAMLGQLDTEWSSAAVSSHPPEVEWPRVRSLEFQEAARTLEALLKRVDTFACVHDPDFDDKVRFPLSLSPSSDEYGLFVCLYGGNW